MQIKTNYDSDGFFGHYRLELHYLEIYRTQIAIMNCQLMVYFVSIILYLSY